MVQILDGKHVAQITKDAVLAMSREFVRKNGFAPGLATLLVGEDPASQVYIRNKIAAAEACGINSHHQKLPATVSESDLLKRIETLNQDPHIHGILVQLPLPPQIRVSAVLEALDPKKDVDGFHPFNVGLLNVGRDCLKPCTPFGVMELLRHYQIQLEGRDALVIGKSNIVGKPMSTMLLNAGATVTVAHSLTQDLRQKVMRAEILVVAVGKTGLIPGDWVREGSVVVDVGMNRKTDGKLCGDVDFELAKQRASFITPVPGGVGPMTIAMLMKNTLKAALDLQAERQ